MQQILRRNPNGEIHKYHYDDQIKVLNQTYGGLDALGGPELDNMYHHGWAYSGASPFQGTKLVAGYFGGTRTPLVISWPKRIQPDGKIRTQFHRVNDIAATITLRVNGKQVGQGRVGRSVPAIFTASETFDVGVAWSSDRQGGV